MGCDTPLRTPECKIVSERCLVFVWKGGLIQRLWALWSGSLELFDHAQAKSGAPTIILDALSA